GYESRGRFLAELTLDPPASTADLAGAPLLDEDYLILSTIHSAKGLEWDVVHVIHASDGNIPSDLATGDDEELEEERRLLYVALTSTRSPSAVRSDVHVAKALPSTRTTGCNQPPPRWIVFQRDADAISCRSFHPRRYSSKAGSSLTTTSTGGGIARRSAHRGPR